MIVDFREGTSFVRPAVLMPAANRQQLARGQNPNTSGLIPRWHTFQPLS